MDVCFQENAWVDTRTNVYSLKKMAECLGDWMEENELVGVQFEDNLGSHKTSESNQAWRTLLPLFRPPRYYPARLTGVVQPIDRHIGIIFKRAVYKSLREEYMRRMQAAGAGVRPEPLTAAEKRIFITKSIGDTYDRLWDTPTYKRSFIATGTWLPITHLVNDDGAETGTTDTEISLQGLKEYEYNKLVTKTVVTAEIQRRTAEAEAEAARAEAEAAAVRAEEARKQALYRESAVAGAHMWSTAKDHQVVSGATLICSTILDVTEYDKIIIAGSWPASVVIKAVCASQFGVPPIDMKPDDIDVYHGAEVGDFGLVPGGNSYIDGPGGLKVNLVKLSGGCSVESLLANNDVNITSVSIQVSTDPLNGNLQTHWTIPPVFWHFLLKERIIHPVNKDTPARTMMRIAYKSYKLGLPCNTDGLDPLNGVLFKSHQKKYVTMGEWVSRESSPINKFRLKVVKTDKEWKFVEKAIKIRCSQCQKKWSNARCEKKLCAGCCLQTGGCSVHKNN